LKGLVAIQVDTDDQPLPFADGRFPCVISDSALEHRYFPGKGLSECARVLSPGGTFLLLLPNIAHWRHRMQLLFGRLPEVVGGPTDRCHLRFFALPEMKQMVRGAGLVTESVHGYASLWVKGLYPAVFRCFPLKQLYPKLVWLRPSLFGRDLILVCKKPAKD
jgi:SAM-dependent methyltransferase